MVIESPTLTPRLSALRAPMTTSFSVVSVNVVPSAILNPPRIDGNELRKASDGVVSRRKPLALGVSTFTMRVPRLPASTSPGTALISASVSRVAAFCVACVAVLDGVPICPGENVLPVVLLEEPFELPVDRPTCPVADAPEVVEDDVMVSIIPGGPPAAKSGPPARPAAKARPALPDVMTMMS